MIMSSKRNSGSVLAALLVVFALCATACGSAATAGNENSSSNSSSQPSNLDAIVQGFMSLCASNGESNPASVEYVQTTAGKAESTVYGSGDSTDLSADTPVIVLAAKGSFTGSSAKVPPGQEPPTGGVITEIAVLSSGATADWGISDSYPSLDTLGDVVTVQ